MTIQLRYFKPEEFQGQFDLVSAETLSKLDEFRDLWGAPVRISPAAGAIARHLGLSSESQHNVDRWGVTRAVDIMPTGLGSRRTFQRAINIAKQVGFSGIGIYPHWKPSPGLHLDTRPGRTPNQPAMWGAIRVDGRQQYVGVEDAMTAAETAFA